MCVQGEFPVTTSGSGVVIFEGEDVNIKEPGCIIYQYTVPRRVTPPSLVEQTEVIEVKGFKTSKMIEYIYNEDVPDLWVRNLRYKDGGVCYLSQTNMEVRVVLKPGLLKTGTVMFLDPWLRKSKTHMRIKTA